VDTLCIDFGTSSIRAAIRRQKDSISHPLAIAPRSQIDNASIPSAIFIPIDGDQIFFGDKALEAGLSAKPRLLFESSPKSWLSPTNISQVYQSEVRRAPFTRFQLIAGLLALAVQDSIVAGKNIFKLKTSALSYRISHPVWSNSDRQKISAVYDQLSHIAFGATGSTITHEMSTDQFNRWYQKVNQASKKLSFDVKVEEPVAAALELLPDPPTNNRSATLVVDVGAGTIDLGLFVSVLPDEDSKVTRKLIPMTPARSLFGAGDEIDDALIKLVAKRLGPNNGIDLAALKNDIRRTKETLFDTGNLVFRKIQVSREELVRTERLRQIASGLKTAIKEMLEDAGSRFNAQLRASNHGISHLDVVFAGGGANLQFLREIVGEVVSMGDTKLTSSQKEVNTPRNFGVDASLARMAVALGGTTPAEEWPKTEMQQATFRSLSKPLR
jgi:molecular chaperone DnaK (HSP70)